MSRPTNIQPRLAVVLFVCGAGAVAISLASRWSEDGVPSPQALNPSPVAATEVRAIARPARRSEGARVAPSLTTRAAATERPNSTAVVADLDLFLAPRDNDDVPHPKTLEATWASESIDEDSSQTLRDIVSGFESPALDESAVKRIDCRETLCRLEIDAAPAGIAAYVGLGLLLNAPLTSSAEGAPPGLLVAYVAQDAIESAKEVSDAPALPFAYWE